jgi:stage V sporulation protein G
MKIERMNKGSWGKARAFFDIRTQEGLVVKGFKIMEGINGLFVSMPSQKGKNQQGEDEWFDTVWIEKELRDQLNQLALNAYSGDFNDTMSSPPQPAKQEMPSSSSSSETSSNEPVVSSSEDEIPF